jgi:mannose-6-phosphate isomerase-like protein (cupin superfamily)
MSHDLARHPDELPWETWDDPALRARSPCRWKILTSARRGPSQGLCCGIAELAPGTTLLLHHHAPPELYLIESGDGVSEVDGVRYVLRPGTALFIPANARHRTTAGPDAPLRILFVFPTDSFEEIVYHFDE